MTDLLNGADRVPLAGWAIAVIHGHIAIGKRDGNRLSPVYEWSVENTLMMSPQGPQPIVVRQLLSFLNTPSIVSLDVPESALWIAIETFSDKERRDLHRQILARDEQNKSERAAEAGVLLAPASAIPKRH